MSKCGLTIRKDLIAHGDYTSSCAAPFVDGFVKSGATAIVCASDLIAHGVLAELYKLGLNVPRDISVVGFDDIPLRVYDPLCAILKRLTIAGRLHAMVTIMDAMP
jgi:LacI family transcriptional regulator